MNECVRKHEDRIHGVLSCFDRMLFRGDRSTPFDRTHGASFDTSG